MSFPLGRVERPAGTPYFTADSSHAAHRTMLFLSPCLWYTMALEGEPMAILGAYYGVTLSLADTTAHSLLDLLTAAVVDFAQVRQNCNSLRIQSDLNNAALTVRVGDSSVSTTRCAYEISTHDQVPYESPSTLQVVPLGAIYVLASAATALIHVEIIFG